MGWCDAVKPALRGSVLYSSRVREAARYLDPSRRGNLTAPRKLFGIIPFGSKLRNYFDGYKSAQSHISTILARLAARIPSRPERQLLAHRE